MSPPLVGTITIWFRASGDDVSRFVANLRALGYPRLQPVFVIHDLAQAEVDQLRQQVPQAIVIEPGANLGSAAGWNLGISCLLERGADYVGVWNEDVRLESSCLDRLVTLMESDPGIGASQPVLIFSDRPATAEMFGGSASIKTGRGRHDYSRVLVQSLPATHDADYLDGGTMLIRAALLRQLGGFDERFFMYAEDTDLSLRIRRAGYRTVAVRDAQAWHYHRERVGMLPLPHQLFYETRNQFYFVRKHGGALAWWTLVARSLVWGLPRGLVFYLRRGKMQLARAFVAGTLSGAGGGNGKQGWVD